MLVITKKIFGYELPHDCGHGKVWIANKIKVSFIKIE
jgi:hypothetical protein